MNVDSLKYVLTEKDYKELIYASVSVVVLMVIIYMNAFENNNYTCNNLLVNTYLYVLISLILFHIMSSLIINYELHIKFFKLTESLNFFLLLFGLFFIIVGLTFIFHMNYKNIFISHFMLLVLISFFSLLISITYARLKKNNLYNKTFYTTLLLISVLLILFYFNQDLIKEYLTDEYYYIVFILLFVVFIIQVFYITFIEYTNTTSIIFSSVILVIFGYFLLADTQRILNITKENCNTALKNCNERTPYECNVEDYPSYPQKSFDIFMSIITIFEKIGNMYLSGNED